MSKAAKKKYTEPKTDELNIKIIKGYGGTFYLYINDVQAQICNTFSAMAGDVVCSFNTSFLDFSKIK
jgi:hypothetical protein